MLADLYQTSMNRNKYVQVVYVISKVYVCWKVQLCQPH